MQYVNPQLVKGIILTLLCCANLLTHSLAQEIKPLIHKEGVSFRGLAVYGENCVWASGSGGTVGKSLDGGLTWSWVSPAGYEKFDFRDIEVFSKSEALVLSAGSPAVILRTTDGGTTWKQVYRDDDPAIFLDGMDFKGKEGFVVGDPIDGVFQLLQSEDKGKTWKDVSNFMFLIADSAEAAFAASGTSIRYLNRIVWVGTGGSTANVFKRNEKALTMDKLPCPIQQGTSSQGIFSLDFWDDATGIVVGGDYRRDTLTQNTILLTFDGGQSWTTALPPSTGFKSAVKYMTKKLIIATGTSGTAISRDGGWHWESISKESFNSLAVAKKEKIVYLAGSNGNIGKVHLRLQ